MTVCIESGCAGDAGAVGIAGVLGEGIVYQKGTTAPPVPARCIGWPARVVPAMPWLAPLVVPACSFAFVFRLAHIRIYVLRLGVVLNYPAGVRLTCLVCDPFVYIV